MKRFHIGHILFLGAVLMIAAGCVSSSKYRMLEESSAAEKDRLEGEVALLKVGIAKLETEKSELNDEIFRLQGDLSRSNDQAAALNDRVMELEDRVTLTEQEKREKEQEIARLTGTYENLVEDLKGEIEKGEIKVTQIRNKLKVNLVEKVLFNSGRAEVNQQGKEILKKVGDILKEVEDKDIRIEGYTDNVPIGGVLKQRFPSNWELSAERATQVLRFLQEEAEVDGSRLSGVGYGEFRPIASNDTPEGRAQNRRIEIVLVPKDIRQVLEEIQ